MYKYRKSNSSLIVLELNKEGETIEQKVRRLINNKEPIKDGAPLIYTDRKDGVLPGYNIRTDRFEIAAEATDKITRSTIAKRDAANKKMENVIDDVNKMKPNDGKTEPTAGKAENIQSK